MKYLNSTDNEYRREYEMLASPETHHIDLFCRPYGRYFIPDINGNVVVWAKFRRMTVDNYWFVDHLTRTGDETNPNDYEDSAKLFLKFQLSSWSLNIPLEFDENNWLTDKCWKIVLGLPFPLIEAFAVKYQDTFIIDNEEETIIDRQCGTLFAKNTRGVENACDAVSLFCILGNMWEKFGLNRFDIRNLSYKEFRQLRLVMSKEIDKHRAERAGEVRRARTNIAGHGGRSRPSRGVTIENPA